MIGKMLVGAAAAALLALGAEAQPAQMTMPQVQSATPTLMVPGMPNTPGGPAMPGGPGLLRPRAAAPADFIKQLDKNGDGKISRAEFGQIPGFERMDQNEDGQLEVWELEITHLADRPQLDAFIKSHDKDGDGALSAAELPVSATRFARLDTDGDKQINALELAAISRPPASLGAPGAPPLPAERAAQLEQRMMARWDANHDGKITKEEFTGTPDMWEHMDGNKDGVITAQEMLEARDAFGRTANEAMREADANHDGKISRQEFRGNDELFKQMDRNGDGVIDAADRALPGRVQPPQVPQVPQAGEVPQATPLEQPATHAPAQPK